MDTIKCLQACKGLSAKSNWPHRSYYVYQAYQSKQCFLLCSNARHLVGSSERTGNRRRASIALNNDHGIFVSRDSSQPLPPDSPGTNNLRIPIPGADITLQERGVSLKRRYSHSNDGSGGRRCPGVGGRSHGRRDSALVSEHAARDGGILLVVADAKSEPRGIDLAVAPEEQGAEDGLGEHVEDGVEGRLGVGRDEVAAFGNAPGDGIEEPEEGGEGAALEEDGGHVFAQVARVQASFEGEDPYDVEQGDAALRLSV